MKRINTLAWAPIALAFALASVPLAVNAQQDSSSTSTPPRDEQPKPAASSGPWLPGVTSSQDTGPVDQPPPDPYAGSIKDVGSGLPLFGTSATPLRWGSFSIYTFESMGIHDDFDPGGNAGSITTDLGIFRTGLMFDHSLFRNKSRIVLQYLPQMMIINGEVRANAATNNNVSLGTQFQLTPRLLLSVGNNFSQQHSNSLIPQNYLATDSHLGSLSQNNFLSSNGNFLADSASITVEYALSPRTDITFSPAFRYMRTLDSNSQYLANGQAYTGTVSLGHRLTPHRTIGLSGSYQYLQEKIADIPQNANYTTAGVFYSEQLARTLWISASVGGTNQKYTGLGQSGGWGLSSSFSINKGISSRASAALAYTRGTVFSDYVSRQRSDRVDASIGILLSSRINWSNSAGYLRELGGVAPTIGKYASSDLTYRFFGNFSLFTTFAYTLQNSNTQQLLSGDRRTVVFGIRWFPGMLNSQ